MAIEVLKILAIDDTPNNLITLQAVVRDALPGAAVVTALSGPQGIALARAEDPDVILLDIVLPGMDGYAVCRALKADERLRPIPVVFLTALRADRESRLQALEAGAEAFLAKPLDEVELIAQIRAMAKIKAANLMQRLEREQLAALVAERTRALEQELAERRRLEMALENRLVVLTRPLDQPGGVAFEDLFELAAIQRLQDEFAVATGVASIITRPDGTPITRPSNFCRLCEGIIRQTETGRTNCFRSDALIGRYHPDGPVIQPCLSGGLWDAGASITVGDRHIANWLIGQVRDETQTEEKMREYAQTIGVNETTFLEAFREVPAMSSARFRQIAQVLFTLANQLSTIAYQNIQQARFIAEAKRAEEVVKNTLWFQQVLMDAVPAPIFYKDAECVYIGGNKAFERYLGLTPEQFIGKTVYDISPGDLAEQYDKADRDLLNNPGVQTYETSVVYADGTRHDVVFNKAAFTNAEGKVAGLIGVILDITERKRAEDKLRANQRQLADIIDFLPDATLAIDQEKRVIIWNKAIEEMTGIPATEMIGKGDYAYTIPFYGEARPQLLDLVFADNEELAAQYPIITREGDTLTAEVFCNALYDNKGTWVFAKASPLHDQAGNMMGAIESIHDITERKQAEEALRNSEGHLHTLVQTIPDLIWLKNKDGVYISCNKMFERFFGAREADIVGKSDYDFVDRELGDFFLEHDRKAMQAGKPTSNEEWITFADDGHRALLDTIKTPMYNDKGTLIGVLGIGRDITERKQAEQRAFELALERERMALLTKFILDVSHEFRTPLAIMQTNLYLLERLEDPAKRQRKLAQIGDQVTGITRLVELLVEMARLDSGVPFTTTPTDLNQWIGAVAAKLGGAAAAKGLTLQLALTPDLPLVPADGNRLDRALHELLDNAVRFTPTGGSVTVRTASDADGVTVEVQDTGPGIPPDVLPHIFERFYRQDVTHTTPGFGLGLPIARAIVERHGGRLEVESQPGAGSVFRIRFPWPNSAEASAQ